MSIITSEQDQIILEQKSIIKHHFKDSIKHPDDSCISKTI